MTQRFGRWTVLGDAGYILEADGKKRSLLSCRCDCGTVHKVRKSDLRRGHSKSCGCLALDRSVAACKTHGQATIGKVTAEYRAWLAMKGRCYNPLNAKFSRYGERGITVCARWLNSFENFLSDMGPRPTKAHSLNRKNNDGDYSPSNCEWATAVEQANNKSTTFFLDCKGLRLPLSVWARIVGKKRGTIKRRLLLGLSPEEALSRPVASPSEVARAGGNAYAQMLRGRK
jgi:hypothetical protein